MLKRLDNHLVLGRGTADIYVPYTLRGWDIQAYADYMR
jgi:hypothetical protein